MSAAHKFPPSTVSFDLTTSAVDPPCRDVVVIQWCESHEPTPSASMERELYTEERILWMTDRKLLKSTYHDVEMPC